MGRPRKNPDGLPEGVTFYHGAYYYRRNGKKEHLGRDRAAALRQHAAILVEEGGGKARGELCSHYIDRHLAEVLLEAAESTHRDLTRQYDNLRRAFGAMRPENIEPKHIYAYMDARALPNEALGWKGAPVQANREVSQLSQLFKRMIKWGVVTVNPCREVERFSEFARTRVPAPAELEAFKGHASGVIQCYMDFKAMTGMRLGDILSLPRIPLDAEGFEVEYGKSRRHNRATAKHEATKKKWYLVTPDMRELLKRIYALPHRPQITQALFCTRKGKAYTPQGFRNLRAYHAHKAWAAGVERFRDHDIRATVASLDPANARVRLGHSKQSTTDRYLRQIQVDTIEPLAATVTTLKGCGKPVAKAG